MINQMDYSTHTFTIVSSKKATPIYIDKKANDYDGLRLIADAVARDIEGVTGIKPAVISDISDITETAIIAGSIGNNTVIDSLIASDTIDITSINGKWECYKIQVVDNPVANIQKAIIIVGSDKRGTIYGMFHIIQDLIGISPWVYWGDVPYKPQEEIRLSYSQLSKTSKEPSVKFRGIFLNDDWPSLGNWTLNQFGGFNEKFYEHVFELILRLKGNYLWPAMWSAIFSEDGYTSSIANAELANTYGIVMGTSHHEPLYRAGSEWQNIYSKYGTSNKWEFATNGEAISHFWEDGVIRNKDYESIITLGMRGEQDSHLSGSDEYNIELLKSIILDQKSILSKHNLATNPQVLTVYKEVEKYWYGTDKAQGLKDWDILDDVTIILTEDNFGNLRTLPTFLNRNRKSGWGMYYHFDYHGGPHSYEWINTVPLEKIWDQMSMAYDYGIQDIWIVNVGDLKPMELPMSYFLDLAYDFDTWGTNGINKTKEYLAKWVYQQFGHVAVKETLEDIADILNTYTKLNGIRKPEIIKYNTFNLVNYKEAKRILELAIMNQEKAEYCNKLISKNSLDSYYQLVYYPAVASANIIKMQIYAGLNELYYSRGSVLANEYASFVKEAIEYDLVLQDKYNNVISNGKWKGLMSSYHIGYTKWDATDWKYPDIKYIEPTEHPVMIVDLEGLEKASTAHTLELPLFTDLNYECYEINISNGGNKEFTYSVELSDDWIIVDKMQDTVIKGSVVKVSVDWSKLSKSTTGYITLKGAEAKVIVRVEAKTHDVIGLPNMTFIETHGYLAIEAEHFVNNVPNKDTTWKIINNYGRTLSSVKMYPTTNNFESILDAPYLEYNIYVEDGGEYNLTTYVAPSNNVDYKTRQRYAVSFDESMYQIADTMPKDFIGGDYNSYSWCRGVMDNIRLTTTVHTLTKGLHTLRLYGVDAGVIVQKFVLYKGELPMSYLGPEESFYTQK